MVFFRIYCCGDSSFFFSDRALLKSALGTIVYFQGSEDAQYKERAYQNLNTAIKSWRWMPTVESKYDNFVDFMNNNGLPKDKQFHRNLEPPAIKAHYAQPLANMFFIKLNVGETFVGTPRLLDARDKFKNFKRTDKKF